MENNKWKIFLWKILNNSLPIGKEFIKRRIIVESMCRFCEKEIETLEHLFRDCSISRHVWAAGRLGLRTDQQTNISISIWIWNWFRMFRSLKDGDSKDLAISLH